MLFCRKAWGLASGQIDRWDIISQKAWSSFPLGTRLGVNRWMGYSEIRLVDIPVGEIYFLEHCQKVFFLNPHPLQCKMATVTELSF